MVGGVSLLRRRMEQPLLTLAQLAKATRIKPRDITFAARWCGLELDLPRRNGEMIYGPTDMVMVRQWLPMRIIDAPRPASLGPGQGMVVN